MHTTKKGFNKTSESLRTKPVQERGGKRQEDGLNQRVKGKVEEKNEAYLRERQRWRRVGWREG